MLIAGGLYVEQCCLPQWNCVFGSGGRSAAAISVISPNTTLYTYGDNTNKYVAQYREKFDVNLVVSHRDSDIVFSYFHPLSNPLIYPPLEDIERQPPILLEGESVLRFGFLEGEAIVNAQRAVFDPQTWRGKPSFNSNGSKADELSIVLNELELLSLNPTGDIKTAAFQLMKEEKAKVVVVKRGAKGVEVFESSGYSSRIPAYKTTRVFKIGTGDIFSATYAHYWAERKMSAIDAANLASKSVAAYCCSANIPITCKKSIDFQPTANNKLGTVLLVGKAETLGNRFVLEEARFVLNELGVNVICPSLNDKDDGSATSCLVIMDTLSVDDLAPIQVSSKVLPTVLLIEGEYGNLVELADLKEEIICDDFTSAIYHAVWAATE